LLQIDALPAYVLVITATNHPELLDRAVWRRFQIRLELPPPTRAQVERYFTCAEKSLQFTLGLSPRTLADRLHGVSFAELEDFVADVSRAYVLALPDADTKRIVQQRLKQWRDRFQPNSRT